MSSSLKKLASQTAIYGLSSILGRFLNYLLTPLWTNEAIFSKEQFGVITEMYAYVAFLVVLLTYGMETTFFRFANKPENNSTTVFSTALLSVSFTTAAFIGISIFYQKNIADWLMYPEHTEYVVWFAFIVGLDAISSIPLAQLRLLNKAKEFALINMANILVNIGLNVFFLFYCKINFDNGNTNWIIDMFYNPNIGVGYVFIANLIASLVKFILLVPYCNNFKFDFNKPLFQKMLRYTMPLLFVGLAGIVNETIDRILLKRLLVGKYTLKETMGFLGVYGANYKLSIIITLFIQAFRYAAEPFFFSMEKQNNSKVIYAKVMHYFIIVLNFVFLAVILHLDILKYFINNKELWEGLDIVPILLLANICLGVYYNLSIWYKLSEKTGYGAIISIIGAVATIILNLALIPFFGYRGSAWATLLCYALMVVISYYWGQKFYPIPYKIKRAIGYFFITGMLLLAGKLLDFETNSILFWIKNSALLFIFIALFIKLEKVQLTPLLQKIKLMK